MQRLEVLEEHPSAPFKMLASTARTFSAVAGSSAGRRYASSIALKYSNAAFKAAVSKSPETLNKVQSELTQISTSIKDTPELSAFISNPLIPAKDRATGLEALYKAAQKGAKEPVSDVTKNLFSVLSENGRLAETPDVIEGFNELVAKHKGVLDIVVTSAAPLAKDVLTKLETTLKQSEAAKQAKTLKIVNKVCFAPFKVLSLVKDIQVNPSIMGGIMVDVGDKTIDLSVSARVNKLNSLLQRKLSSHCTCLLF